MARHVLVLALLGGLTGCVATTYTKTITVEKDAEGKVLRVIEFEGVVQPGQGHGIKFQHLKGIVPFERGSGSQE